MSTEKTSKAILDSPVYEYHHRTKHTVEKLFSGGHFLDWANQPDPFLRFRSSPEVRLPTNMTASRRPFFDSICDSYAFARGEQADGAPSAMPYGLQFISSLLYYSMSISAWKQIRGTDHRWALRVNASSGNLHPTETYLVTGELKDTNERPVAPAGLYHYRVDRHVLERRMEGNLSELLWKALDVVGQPPQAMLVLSSVFWREAWKYRERAFRYCQHDLGHALGTVTVAAASLGWTVRHYGLFADDCLESFLSMEEGPDKPLAVLALYPAGLEKMPDSRRLAGINVAGESAANWEALESAARKTLAAPITLSKQQVTYPSIDKVYKHTKYSIADFLRVRHELSPEKLHESINDRPGKIVAADQIAPIARGLDGLAENQYVHKIIRKRRSAVDMDGKTRMSRRHLEAIITASTGGFSADFQIPDHFDGMDKQAADGFHLIHLYLYVHRVDGLDAGLYFVDRKEHALVPLLLSDQKEMAKSVSCFQDIAADGAFAVSMIADLDTGYKLFADRCYRLAHFEAGFIGQLFYLSACALGYDSTGIGCFLDDAINDYVALSPGWQVLYNFTFGRAVLDDRLTSLPSYDFNDPTIE